MATGRSNGMSIEGRKTKLNQIIRGWVQYFKLADMKTVMQSIDEWLRKDSDDNMEKMEKSKLN